MTTNNAALAVDAASDRNEESPRPFLKWAGGKGFLLDTLRELMPRSFNTYYEPFIGGGALFFACRPERAHLVDVNHELINTYQTVRDNVSEVIAELEKHRYEKEYYYQLRNVDRTPEYQQWTAVERAGRFIFLNKTCFNGLYRVNSKGHFNVPFGDYSNPKLVDHANLNACSRALQAAELTIGDFEGVLVSAREGDFVYFDPPYVPASPTANFTGFSAGGFTDDDQRRLYQVCVALHERGVRFMLSNSCTELALNLYRAFNYRLVQVPRAINSKGDKRGKVNELIIRNYEQ